MDEDINVKKEAIEQHLMYYKALIDDNVASERINKYIDILAHEEEGEKMLDPVDEAIRAVFSLVIEHDMDPWEIDIREFAKLYKSKLENNFFDMIVAGKLVHMAWKILRMQSDITVANSELRQPEEDFDGVFDFDFFDPVEEESLFVPSVSFTEAQYRSPVRPVSIMEFLDAFEEAREEMAISAERERLREQLKAKEPRKFENKAHEEDDEKDIESVWNLILNLGTGKILLSDLYVNDIKVNITRFVSVLHLVRDGKLNIWQEELPYGEIYIEIKTDWAIIDGESDSDEAEITEKEVI